MKKTLIICILVVIISIAGVIIRNYNKIESNLTKVTVAEVTHSIFYAPWYVAIENNYFEEEGIDIELILTPGVACYCVDILVF